jgi:hypothetical protein
MLGDAKEKLDVVKGLLVCFPILVMMFVQTNSMIRNGSIQASMDQLVVHENASKRDIWKQKVKNLADEHQSLHKAWEKDARRYIRNKSRLCRIYNDLP